MRNGVIVQMLISFEMPAPGLGSQSQWTFIGSDGIVESDSYGKVRLGRGRGLGGRLRDAAVRAQRGRLQPGPAEGVRRADPAVRRRRSRPASTPPIRRSTARTAGQRSRSSRPARDRRTAARRSTCRSTRPDPARRRAPTMEVVERGVVSAAVPGTSRAFSTFPAFVVLADGSLLVTYSIGSGKDTDDLDIELRRSTDGGRTWTEPVTPFETTLDGRRGSLKAAPITRLDGDHLIVAGAVDRPRGVPGPAAVQPGDRGLPADDGPPGRFARRRPDLDAVAGRADAGRHRAAVADQRGPAPGRRPPRPEHRVEQAVPRHVEVVPAGRPPALVGRRGDVVRAR